MRKINRQIYFYEVELQKYSKEENSYLISKNYKEDMKELFGKFKDLPFDKENLNISGFSCSFFINLACNCTGIFIPPIL